MTNPKNPFEQFDLSGLMKNFDATGSGGEAVKSLLDAHQKNIETIIAANQAAAEGYQALAQRQMDIIQTSLQKLTELDPADSSPEKLTESARIGLEQMRELLELAAKANKDAFDIISARAQESMKEIKS
jgi:hypothetical protein